MIASVIKDDMEKKAEKAGRKADKEVRTKLTKEERLAKQMAQIEAEEGKTGLEKQDGTLKNGQ